MIQEFQEIAVQFLEGMIHLFLWGVAYQFSLHFSGQEAVVVKNGSRLCGTGAARSSTPILQNKAYWEFKLQQAGIWSCGLANPGCDLNRNLGTDLNSWCLTHDNVIMFNGDIEHKLEPKIQEGDIIVRIINNLWSLPHYQSFISHH